MQTVGPKYRQKRESWKWTREDEQRLMQMKEQGLHLMEIATALGRSYASVRSKAFQLDPTSRERWSNRDLAALIRMWLDGLPPSEMAARINRTAHSVKAQCMRLGLTAELRARYVSPVTPEGNRLVRLSDACRRYGVSLEMAEAAIARLQIPVRTVHSRWYVEEASVEEIMKTARNLIRKH